MAGTGTTPRQRVQPAGGQDPAPLRLGFLGSEEAVARILAAARAAGFGDAVQASESVITDPYGDLRRGAIDVLVTRFWIDEPDLAVGPVLYREERVVAVAVDHPLAGRPSVLTEDLADYDVFEPPGAFPSDVYDQLVPPRSTSGRPIVRRQRAGSMSEMFDMIARGVAIHPTISSMRARKGHPDVTYVPIGDLAPAPVALSWRRRHETAGVRAFVAAAIEGFGLRTAAGTAAIPQQRRPT